MCAVAWMVLGGWVWVGRGAEIHMFKRGDCCNSFATLVSLHACNTGGESALRCLNRVQDLRTLVGNQMLHMASENDGRHMMLCNGEYMSLRSAHILCSSRSNKS